MKRPADEWYLDQKVRVRWSDGTSTQHRVVRLTKTLVVLNVVRFVRATGRLYGYPLDQSHIEPWSAEDTRSAELARKQAARRAMRRQYVTPERAAA